MSVGDWSKDEAEVCKEAVNEMFEAIPKSKRMGFIGHLNEVLVFLSEAGEHAPDKK